MSNVDRDWGSQPTFRVVSLAEVARMKSERVWVSSPSEMSHMGCLDYFAFWEAELRVLRLGLFPETSVAVTGLYL